MDFLTGPHQVECILAEQILRTSTHTYYAGTWCATEMATRCTLSGALNGSQNCSEKSCKPVVTPSTRQSIGFTIWTFRYIAPL